MGLNYQTKRLSDFRSEKSLRCDYKYASSFNMNYQEFYSYKDLFDFVSYKKIELSQLDSFQYAEISNVNKLGEVEPIHYHLAIGRKKMRVYSKKLKKVTLSSLFQVMF